MGPEPRNDGGHLVLSDGRPGRMSACRGPAGLPPRQGFRRRRAAGVVPDPGVRSEGPAACNGSNRLCQRLPFSPRAAVDLDFIPGDRVKAPGGVGRKRKPSSRGVLHGSAVERRPAGGGVGSSSRGGRRALAPRRRPPSSRFGSAASCCSRSSGPGAAPAVVRANAWSGAQYLLLGVLVPALLAAAGVAGRLLRGWGRPLALLKAGLGGGCLLLAWAYLPQAAFDHVKPVWLFFVAVLLALLGGLPACRPGADSADAPTYLLAGLLASGVAWLALSGWLVSPPPFFASIWQFGVIGLALLLSLCNLLRPADPDRGPAALGRVADLAALATIALLAFGWEKPCDLTAWHHWGALVGPAEMVRQGGWLLWDTPSQYGFLCPLALACFPTENAYQAALSPQRIAHRARRRLPVPPVPLGSGPAGSTTPSPWP